MTAASLLAEGAIFQHHLSLPHRYVSSALASGIFQPLGTYTGIGAQLAAVVAPGPTPGSERLYASYIYYGNTFDILSIDPDTGDTTVYHSPIEGELGAWGMAAGPDGNVYLGTLPNAHIVKLDTRKGALLDLGRPSSTASYIWTLAFGSDGRLYGGTSPDCKLIRYDPATGRLEDLGRMDPSEQYVRFVAASKDGFIYAAIGTYANIAAYQISSGNHREILPTAAQQNIFPTVYLGTDGNVYGSVAGLPFSLSQWTASELSSGAKAPAQQGSALSDGRTVSITESISASGSESLTLVVTDPTTNEKVEHNIAYQGNWMDLFRIGLGPDGALYGSSAMPANFIRADMGQGSLQQIGIVGDGEVYSFISHGSSLLMGAYAGLAPLMSYQPELPYPQATTTTNPKLVNFQGDNDSWRPEAMINGPDGNVYLGAVGGYGLLESPLVEWNTANSSVQLFNIVTDQSVVSLTAWKNLVIGGTSISGGAGVQPTQKDAELFVWNPLTQEVEYQFVPVSGAASITDLITAPNGLVYGIAGNTLFEFNPQTEQITNSQVLPFSNFIFNSASVDDTGRVWGLAESGIFMIDTSTFCADLIASAPLQITGGFAMSAGKIYFISGPSIYSYTVPLAVAKETISPAQATLSVDDELNVMVTVAGSGVTPTGTVTVSGGSYTSPVETLVSGNYAFTIPANSLSAGTDTLTVIYSGDTNYAPTTGTATVTVTSPTYTMVATTPATIPIGGTSTATVEVNGMSGYTGTVTLTCALTSAPSGATDLPTCTSDNPTVTLSAGTTVSTTTFTLSAPISTSTLVRSKIGNSRKWFGTSGGAILAVLMCLGIPSRRRSWRSMLGILAVIGALGNLTGCSNSVLRNSSSSDSGNSESAYTFTITGASAPSVSPKPTTAFTVVVKS